LSRQELALGVSPWEKVKASELAAIVNRLAINRPDAKVDYFIKIHP
jgi:hypothetical protein